MDWKPPKCHTKLILCLLELYGSAKALVEFLEEAKFQSAILVKYNTGLCGSRRESGMCYVKLQGSEIVKMIPAELDSRKIHMLRKLALTAYLDSSNRGS